MTNLDIRQFSVNITKYVNSCLLPIEVKRLVLQDILRQTEEEAARTIAEEIKDRDSGEEKGDGI